MKKLIVVLSLMGASSAWSAQVYNMFYLGAVSSPGFFIFDVNGTEQLLLCDQFSPNVTTSPYQALGYSLADFSGTTLGLAGDPDALHKYQMVAILDLQAYADPSLAPDVVRANRFIVDGSGPMTGGSTALYNFALNANPANYPQLANFVILYNAITQEQTGYLGGGGSDTGGGTPEPGTVVLLGAGLTGIILKVRQRRSA